MESRHRERTTAPRHAARLAPGTRAAAVLLTLNTVLLDLTTVHADRAARRPLKVEVAIEVNRSLIAKVPLFKGLSPLATFELISNLSRKVLRRRFAAAAVAAAAAAAAAVAAAAAAAADSDCR